MATTPRDGNRVPAVFGVSDADGITPVPIYVDPDTNEMHVTASIRPGVGADDFEGAPVTVGTTAVELTFTGTPTSIFIQSDHDNTGKIWVGKSTVTNAGANAMARLGIGESLSIDYDDTDNAIYAISDTAAQKVFKLALI